MRTINHQPSRRLFLLAAILGLAHLWLFGTGCNPPVPPTPPTPPVPTGAQSPLIAPVPGTPSSIVSLAPSLTELLFAMGVGDQVKGVTRYCHYPPQARERVVVGGFNDLNVELVLGLRPDLVVGVPSPGNRDPVIALRQLGIRVLILDDSRIDTLLKSIRELGKELNMEEKGETMAANLEDELSRVAARARDLPRPRTVLVLGHRPLVVAGPRSLGGELITLAGGELVPAEQNLDRYPIISMETLMGLNPERIIDGSGDQPGDHEHLREWWSRWTAIPAVAGGNVHILPDTALLRPGINLGANAHTMGARIHGPLWEEPNNNGK